MICWPCWSKENPGQGKDKFVAESNRKWKARSTNAKQSLRVKRWQDIVEENPKGDESQRAYMRRLRSLAAQVVSKVLSALRLAPASQQQKVQTALEEFAEDQANIGSDPTFVPILSEQHGLTQHLSSLCKGVDERRA